MGICCHFLFFFNESNGIKIVIPKINLFLGTVSLVSNVNNGSFVHD